MRRVSLLTVLLLVLSSWALPARADTTPLALTSYTVTPIVSLDPRGPVACDGWNHLDCGYVAVDAYFSGLEGRELPKPGEYQYVLNVGGTVDVTRTYGCRTPDGKRPRKYDQKVHEVRNLGLRVGPRPFPAGVDELRIGAYAFLGDAQPGNCPAGTQAIMYQLVAKQVRLELESQWAPVPSATYSLPGRVVWDGALPTPNLA